MTAEAKETAGPARGRAVFLGARVGYGVALVMAPGTVIYLATGRFPSRRARRVAQVLGARHLIQAGVSAFAPGPGVLVAGAAVDSVHAASMLVLAIFDRGTRRAVLADGLAEALLAAAGFTLGEPV